MIATSTPVLTLHESRSPSTLDHELRDFLPELARFNSTKEMQASDIYARLRPQIERLMSGIVQEDFARRAPQNATDKKPASIKAIAWNIERGLRLAGIISALRHHTSLRESDLLLLTELDYGMARTHNACVAREIAEALQLDYAFAPCYLALNKGSGLESKVAGENNQSLHGNALFSRYPLRQAHSIALPNGKDKMRGKEKRLGSQRAVAAIMDHPLGSVWAVSLHLDAHSTQRHRKLQMRLVLDHLARLSPQLPVVIGGDWNTSTYNSRRAAYSIAGYFRRVLMGVRHVIKNHYPYPERWFERGLFKELERHGYTYRELNEMGTGTLHYCVDDLAVNVNMADWIPQWCFWFIRWALSKNEGRCSLKLDWFAGKNIAVAHGSRPTVVGNLRDDQGALSDHDAIVLNFVPIN
ncbi:MAG: endonuclease/exonuclease/phosphatase family protein [Pyrinomonadaceae bacterium]